MIHVHELTVATKQSRSRVRLKTLARDVSLPKLEKPATASEEFDSSPSLIKETVGLTQTSVHKSAVVFISGTFTKRRSTLISPIKNDLDDLEWFLGL